MLEQVRSAGPKLIPFFKTLAIYFMVFIPHDKPGFIAALLKCLPIISLIIFNLWHKLEEKNAIFRRKIVYGLIFSCIGDFCLVWPNTFDLGMLAFAIGHINYIKAFGFSPLCPRIGFCVYSFCVIGVIWFFPGLHGVLVPGVPIYSFIIGTMLWRALSRLNKECSGAKICAVIGAVCFVLSDILIGIDKFKFKLNHDQILIMTTYYAAQLGISLSILDLNQKI